MIDPTHAVISIARQCELIQLSRASYYRMANNIPIVETSGNLELMRLIDEEYTRHPFYGSRQLRNYLRRQGYPVNRKRVQRLMRLMASCPSPLNRIPAKRGRRIKYIHICYEIWLLLSLIKFGAQI